MRRMYGDRKPPLSYPSHHCDMQALYALVNAVMKIIYDLPTSEDGPPYLIQSYLD